MPDFTIKQNDTRPKLVAALKDDEVPVNLSTAASVKFLMRAAEAGAVKVNKPAAITDAVNGIVTYTWEAANTADVGEFEGEFEVTWNDGGVETFPAEAYIEISIVDDIA